MASKPRALPWAVLWRPFRPCIRTAMLEEESHGFSLDGTAQVLRYGRLGSLRYKGLPWFCRFHYEISGLGLMPFGNSNWPEIDGKMQPRWGRSWLGRLPRVAPPSRPWAERWNPFGIQARNFRKALGLGCCFRRTFRQFLLLCAGTLPGGGRIFGDRFRWYRFAQPPATGWDASGIKHTFAVSKKRLPALTTPFNITIRRPRHP